MTFSAINFSRTRLLALLLVAIFSIGAVGATVVATDASAAKKSGKKAKKCKKGYKKVKGKCKKPKKASSNVSSVALTTASIVDQTTVDPLRISGSINFVKAFSGNQQIEFTIKGTGGTVVEKFNLQVRNDTVKEFTVQRAVKVTPPLTITAKAGGKTSNTISVD